MSDQPTPGVSGSPFRVDLRLVVIAVGLVLLVIALAIGVRQALTGTPTPVASSGDTSPYAQLFAEVGPNGEVTKETALEAFSLAIAPLPGVTVPTGAPSTVAEREDGTFAVDWLRPYMHQLTPDQAAAVEAALAPDPQAPVSTPESSGSSGIGIRLASFTKGDVTSYADDARKAIAANLHRSLAIPWSVTLNHVNVHVNGEDAWAYTTQVDGGAGCAIHVNPLLSDGSDAVLAKVVMAHEMFHCFQGDWLRMLGHVDAAIPAWIIEGQANWAAENVAGPTPYGSNGWGDYLTHPDYSLWQESYNAIGFYQHAEEEQIDPWAHFDAMLTAYTSASLPSSANPDAFKAAGAAADSFLDTWASGYFRDPKRGGPWYATGPWTVDGKAEVDAVPIQPGDTKSASAQPATNMVWTTIAASDVIEVHGQNHVRMYLDPAPELPVVERWLCFKDGGCMCPAGQRYSGPELEDVSAGNNGGYQQIDFGITGSLDGARVTVRGHALAEFCKPLPSPQSTDGQRYPDSNGDPHLRTVNRYKYDFQAAGEFTLIRNADSSIEIQARQEPYRAVRLSPFNAVSINTAVAARDNGHRIGVYMTPAGPVLHVDGALVDPASLPDLRRRRLDRARDRRVQDRFSGWDGAGGPFGQSMGRQCRRPAVRNAPFVRCGSPRTDHAWRHGRAGPA